MFEIQNQKTIPNCLVYFFACIHFIFCFDCGFLNMIEKRYRRLIHYLSIIKSLITIIIVTLPIFYSKLYTYWIYVFEYIICVLILYFKKNSIYDYFNEMFFINYQYSNKKIIRNIKIILSVTLSVVLLKLIINIISCNFVFESCFYMYLPEPLVYLPLYAVDILPVIQVIIIYYIYSSLENTEMYLKLPSNNNIVRIQYSYVAIADCWQKIQPFYFNLVSTK